MATRRELPAPGVRLDEAFPARLAALRERSRRARGRRGGVGAGSAWTRGAEFEGHRPYRPGDDVRLLDWTLLARRDEPSVLLRRPEGGETWAVVLDASASMGLGGAHGEHGKLQRAAEVALGLAVLGLEAGAEVRLLAAPAAGAHAHDGGDGNEVAAAAPLRLRRAAQLDHALAWAAALRAGGAGLADLLPGRPWGRDVDHLFLVGDLFDLRPADVGALARPGLAIGLARVLAPEELDPPGEGVVVWRDPEAGADRTVDLHRSAGAYRRALRAELDGWLRVARRARLRFVLQPSDAPFERAALDLAGPDG